MDTAESEDGPRRPGARLDTPEACRPATDHSLGGAVPASNPKEAAMLIVAGRLCVHPQERDRWVAAHHEITRIARSQPGCLDLHLSADPLEEGRINLFEQWESEAALQAWRAAADPPPKPQILGASIHKHHISWSGSPF